MLILNPTKQLKLNTFNIQSLEIKFDQQSLSEQDAKLLGKTLEKLKSLHILNIDFVNCQLMSQYCFSLMLSGILKCQNLTSLSIKLDQQNMEQQKVFSLSSALAQAKNLTYLKIFMQDHNFNRQGASQLGQALENLKNLKQLTLDLSQQKEKGQYKLGQIGDQGLSDLSKSISQCPNIEEFELNLLNNHILRKGVCNLGGAIAQLKRIRKLNLQLALNTLGDEGVMGFCRELQICQSLQILHINLMQNEIEEGYIEIGTLLGQIENLYEIDINFMQIYQQTYKNISLNIKGEITILQRLQDQCVKDQEKVKVWSQQNQFFTTLTKNFHMMTTVISIMRLFQEEPCNSSCKKLNAQFHSLWILKSHEIYFNSINCLLQSLNFLICFNLKQLINLNVCYYCNTYFKNSNYQLFKYKIYQLIKQNFLGICNNTFKLKYFFFK
ncbi:hypothetical protein TTHERM_000853099 (macronuclear) [Tetrahymena thermophila SB210]|uniref:Kinase domain protein n=1 Tax=Tetrahymena thermophila (strain SB210) TaxID=312017 RepID=W7X1B7_TETTS|nr:hypothetical protein TTHERM_000853099 [Tetrahymena thermophila SB210]EWS71372.1 hypothetical protein TTHERM_000853099 [Tetrahymena thermophila SB210]|eukprot:XP_012656105.1 hypothetical protein TTHERM_000853099 [Tetrahymena thermophila SB210]